MLADLDTIVTFDLALAEGPDYASGIDLENLAHHTGRFRNWLIRVA
jgi:hypothetical protein